MESEYSSLPHANLTTYGRRTNKLHTVEVCFVEEDNKVFLLAHKRKDNSTTDWLQNLRANQKCILNVQGKKYTCRVKSAFDDEDLEKEIMQKFKSKLGDDHFNKWYKGTNRVPVVLSIVN